MRSFLRRFAKTAATVLVAQSMLWAAAAPAQAQSNSREAVEAARKHRADTGDQRSAAPAERAPAKSSTAPHKSAPANTQRPYRSSANPNADPNASLQSCMDNAGMNFGARDRCMRQHCKGRWGQGQCPASGGNVVGGQGGASSTPLGKCLAEAGNNPFRRDSCGWRHCKSSNWGTEECKAVAPRQTPQNN